jgi:quinol monooxygenase YgiN
MGRLSSQARPPEINDDRRNFLTAGLIGGALATGALMTAATQAQRPAQAAQATRERVMSIAQGQFAFVGEIPLTAGREEATKGFVDATTRAEPGLVHASIHRRIDGEGIVIYEARIGGTDEALTYRRALHGHLEKQRWYRPFGRWANQGGVRRVAFMRIFRVISEAGAKDTVVEKLTNLVELVVGQVPELKLAILHEGLDQPNEIMLYEEWDSTKAGFVANEAPKPYRAAYRQETAHLVAEGGELDWLSPIRIYAKET